MKLQRPQTDMGQKAPARLADTADYFMASSPVAERFLSVHALRQLPGFTLNMSFRVPAGLTVLFGPSGSGKSLTLQSIAGLFPLNRAHIKLGNFVLENSEIGVFLPAQKRRVGYVPQNYALFPHLTVAQNIAFGLKASRTNRHAAENRVTELISLMRLDGLENLRPAQISGGQQQRVALARALATDPQLLLLDEPFSSLDVPVRESLREELLDFHSRVGVPIVLVTHDPEEARMLADSVVVVQGGQVLQVGTQDSVFRSPLTPQVAALVGMRPCWSGEVVALLQGELDGSSEAIIQVADLQLRARVPASVSWGQEIQVGIRSDELRIYAGNITRQPQTVLVEGTRGSVLAAGVVVRNQPRGMFSNVTVRLNSGLLLEIPILTWEHRQLGIAVGREVTVKISGDAVHVFEPGRECS